MSDVCMFIEFFSRIVVTMMVIGGLAIAGDAVIQRRHKG